MRRAIVDSNSYFLFDQRNTTLRPEYYQWRPAHNEDSRQMAVSAGDILHGQVTFDESSQVRG